MKMGFRAKVLLSMAFVTTIAAVLIGAAFLKRAEAIVQDNYIKSTLSTMTVSLGTFEEQMQQAYNTAVALAHDDALQQYIAAYRQGGRGAQQARDISRHLQTAGAGQSLIETVYAYLPAEKQVITSTEYSPVREVFYPDQHAWLTQWPEDRKTRLAPELVYDSIRRSPLHTLAFVRPVYSAEGQLLAVISVGINERKLFYQCLSVMGLNSSDTYYLLDGNASIASAASPQYIGAGIGQVLEAPADFTQEGETAFLHDDLLVTSVSSPMTHFKIVGVTNRSDMVAQLRNQQFFIAIILVGTLLVMLVPVALMSKRMYKPIEQLRGAMQEISNGNLSARAEIVSNDEISQLGSGFNDMVDRIEGLIQDVIAEQLQTRQAELEALQYQITPHFMYNTLNSIKYAAHLQQAGIIAEQLGAFIDLLQASINRRGALITVQEEMCMVQNYVKLQQFRYMNLLTIDYTIAPDTERCAVPSLILQPLVENAILHGQQEGGAGIAIHIRATIEGGQLVLVVEDNGKGMTPQQVQQLLTNPKKPKEGFSSIGISNINDRLHLFFAGQADLSYSSEVGKGTVAIIRLPATPLEDETAKEASVHEA